MQRKTNQELLGNIVATILLILVVICGCINGWKGCVGCFAGYVFIVFTGCICLYSSEKIDDFIDWCKQPLADYKIFGLSFKFFSKLW